MSSAEISRNRWGEIFVVFLTRCILQEQELTTTMTTPSHNLTGSSNLESLEVEVEVSTYYPIQNEDEEPITDLPLEPIKPRFFQVRT